LRVLFREKYKKFEIHSLLLSVCKAARVVTSMCQYCSWLLDCYSTSW